jgi:dihydrofolate synthase/folylpolyglutamate synthase
MAEKSREGLLFCAGSLYLIGEIKAVLEQKT